MLCSVVLRGVAEVVRALPLAPGRDFALVAISLDPEEIEIEAAAKQSTLAGQAGVEPARWRYLRGAPDDVRAVADALGFRYARDPVTEQIVHPAALFVLTPDVRVADTVHGVRFSPAEVETALRLARSGRVATADAAEALRCFRFDDAGALFQSRLQRVFRLGALVVLAAVAALVATLIVHDRGRR